MKTKTKKRLAGAAGILIILGLLLAVDGFTGDPLSRAWAQWRALHRAGTLYPEQEFYVASSYSGQFFNYGVTVQSATILRVQIDTINILWLLFLYLQKYHKICTFSFFAAHPHGIGYRFLTCNSRLNGGLLSY